MRQFVKILFACLCAIILFVLITVISLTGIATGIASSVEETELQDNSVLCLDMNETVSDQGKENVLSFVGGGEQSSTGLNDILASIKNAKTDDKIKGIYIVTGTCSNGWASLQEIKEALIDFKTSKKFIYAYGEIADQKSYYVASVSDKIYLNPSGMLEFKGLEITGTFFKGTMDKLDVTSEAFHCGKYKGAYEPYKLEKFSEPNRYQLSVLLNDFYAEFLQTVSVRTSIDTATLAKMANEGRIKFPNDAVANNFIDGLVFSDSVEHIMKGKLNLKDNEKIEFVSPSDYAQTIQTSIREKNKIAVLYASGEIHDGEGNDGIYSKTMTTTIRKMARDESIKAVVLRINSPGGSALASELIYHELMQLKAKKPLVISMGNYAASGGYYMACAGDSIFAESTSLTGSIGVVGVLFNIEAMMRNKLGVTFDNVKTGQFADFPTMSRPMTDLERAWMQSYLDSTYTIFKSRVSTARKLTMAQVEELAQGHVYSGKLAKELKLVDQFGNIDRALQSVAAMAKINEYKVVEYPTPVDQLDEILSSVMGKKREEASIKQLLGDDYIIYKEIQKVRSQENQIQAILPMNLDIK